MGYDAEDIAVKELRKYYTFGLTMIQLMVVTALLALLVTAIYHFCSGGTAG
jgi:hypothetical protein